MSGLSEETEVGVVWECQAGRVYAQRTNIATSSDKSCSLVPKRDHSQEARAATWSIKILRSSGLAVHRSMSAGWRKGNSGSTTAIGSERDFRWQNWQKRIESLQDTANDMDAHTCSLRS